MGTTFHRPLPVIEAGPGDLAIKVAAPSDLGLQVGEVVRLRLRGRAQPDDKGFDTVATVAGIAVPDLGSDGPHHIYLEDLR